MSYQLAKVNFQKNRAFSIFTKTKAKFEKAIAQARAFIEKNETEILELTEELNEKTQINEVLRTHIEGMDKSVKQINHIIGE